MLPEETARFSLSELVDASGMPERTVRFYIDQGLIPPALGKGRSRYYTPEHLQLLEQVKTLRENKSDGIYGNAGDGVDPIRNYPA